MSAIASFTKISKAALNGLREAARPAPRDSYHEYLRQHGRSAAEYEWSGYVLATLLVYLQAERQIDLMKSEFDELSAFLTNSRGSAQFILTDAHKQDCLTGLNGEFSEQALCDYYNEFNGAAETDMGKPMVDGVRAFRDSLNQVDDSSVILFSIE